MLPWLETLGLPVKLLHLHFKSRARFGSKFGDYRSLQKFTTFGGGCAAMCLHRERICFKESVPLLQLAYSVMRPQKRWNIFSSDVNGFVQSSLAVVWTIELIGVRYTQCSNGLVIWWTLLGLMWNTTLSSVRWHGLARIFGRNTTILFSIISLLSPPRRYIELEWLWPNSKR